MRISLVGRRAVVSALVAGLVALASVLVPQAAQAHSATAAKPAHIITCSNSAERPALYGSTIIGYGSWQCSALPDIVSNCVHIERFISGYGWVDFTESCSGTAQSGSTYASTYCASGAFSYRTVEYTSVFHGFWIYHTATSGVSIFVC